MLQPHDIQLEKFRVFHRAAFYKNFTKAAKTLYVTEGAISQQIKDLEWKLGKKLFHRQGPKLGLTEEGKLLFVLVDPIINQFDQIIDTFMQLTESIQQQIRIVTTQSVSSNLLPPIIAKFNKEYANIRIIVTTPPPEKLCDIISSREADIGIAPLINIPDSIATTELARFRWFLLAPPHHPLAKYKDIKAEDIAAFPVIMPAVEDGHGAPFDTLTKMYHVNLKPSVKVARWEVIKRYVATGLGVAIVPEICVENIDKNHIIIRTLDHLLDRVPFGILTNRISSPSSPMERFCALLVQFCQNKYPSV